MSSSKIDDERQFFKIGDVAEVVGVKPHVLRYWESEINALRPLKTRGAHRMYRRADIEIACLLRRLLHEEGYTLSGAKKRIQELARQRPRGGVLDVHAAREAELRLELVQVRGDLYALLDSLTATSTDTERVANGVATVMAVVPKTVLLFRER
jgi:DNA-binding transcriptional MerR regulator